MSKSDLESDLLQYIILSNLPAPEREATFHPKRKWRVDFIWRDAMLIVECEGGVYANGRHVRGLGFTADCVKYNEAALMGYRVLRVTADHIYSGQAAEWIGRALSMTSVPVAHAPVP